MNAVTAYDDYARMHRHADPHQWAAEIIRMDVSGYTPRDIAQHLRLDMTTVLTVLVKESPP